jgi:hypothetical protein
MKDKSEISYWLDDENILTVQTHKVPEIGEEIWITTLMDEDWHDSRFPNRKLFRKGIRGKFKVISVQRSYRNYDYVLEETRSGSSDTSGQTTYQFPAQRTVESFEVAIERL